MDSLIGKNRWDVVFQQLTLKFATLEAKGKVEHYFPNVKHLAQIIRKCILKLDGRVGKGIPFLAIQFLTRLLEEQHKPIDKFFKEYLDVLLLVGEERLVKINYFFVLWPCVCCCESCKACFCRLPKIIVPKIVCGLAWILL